MCGWVTEAHLEMADEAFPGIRSFWLALEPAARPRTFLELVALFMKGNR